MLQTFQTREYFGVNHPMQVIDFDLTKMPTPARACNMPTASRLYSKFEGGKKSPSKLICAGQSRQWKLLEGRSPKVIPTNLKVNEYTARGRSGYQITNGITGIRVTKPADPGTLPLRPLVDLFNYGPDVPRIILLAPVQGIQFPDSQWSGAGPNVVTFLAKSLVKADIRFLEKGPLKVVVEVSYLLDHPAYSDGSIELKPAGRGHYRSTITVEAGQPSILFDEDTDLEMTWSMDLYEALQPTTAGYCGHHASRRNLATSPTGRPIGLFMSRPGMDAQVDLAYDITKSFSYSGGADNCVGWRVGSVGCGHRWYWQMFNANAGRAASCSAS